MGAPVEVGIDVARDEIGDHLLDESTRSDLLVLGAEPDDRHRALLIRLAASARCPIVVVPDLDLTVRAGVVVGIDGSDVSVPAMRFAADEAAATDEPLIAAGAWERDGPRTDHEGEAAMRVELAARALVHDHPRLRVHECIERESPRELLRDLGASARLLVVGSHGRGAVARALLGSVSSALVVDPPAPVVVVRRAVVPTRVSPAGAPRADRPRGGRASNATRPDGVTRG
nr:universal stress protein [Microbacterium aquimaris]